MIKVEFGCGLCKAKFEVEADENEERFVGLADASIAFEAVHGEDEEMYDNCPNCGEETWIDWVRMDGEAIWVRSKEEKRNRSRE
jgi:hypothetical protein